VAVEEGELIAAFVQPRELAPRIHQPQQELPRLAPFAPQLDHHLEKIDLRFARAMNQRHVHFLALAALLPQILAHQRGSDRIPLAHQLPLYPGPGQPLLRGRPWLPLRQQLVQPRLYTFPDRPLPRASRAHRLRLMQILVNRVAAHPELTSHPPHALSLD